MSMLVAHVPLEGLAFVPAVIALLGAYVRGRRTPPRDPSARTLHSRRGDTP